MLFVKLVLLPTAGILAAMFVSLEAGRALRRRWPPADGEDASAGHTETAVFALLGLLIAFTFSSAASRFEERRALILAEANAIGTAYLRVDLLSEEARPRVKEVFRDYVRSRLETYRRMPDLAAAKEEYGRSVALQGELWALAVPAARAQPSPAVATLLLPALNDTFDLANARIVATRTHVPEPVLVLLYGMACVAALIVGFSGPLDARRTWVRKVLFSLAIATSLFVILDLEYPRVGFLKLDSADLALEEVLAGMR